VSAVVRSCPILVTAEARAQSFRHFGCAPVATVLGMSTLFVFI
jgi:hypothetical protein